MKCRRLIELTRFHEHRASHVPYLLPGAEETLACQTGNDPERKWNLIVKRIRGKYINLSFSIVMKQVC